MGKSQWVNFHMPKPENKVIADKKPPKKSPTIVELGKWDKTCTYNLNNM